MTPAFEHKLEIAEVVNNWVSWSDSGDWARFATVWHADGWITVTLFDGPAAKFIEINKARFERGTGARHLLGGISIDVVGQRAISQAKVTIVQRGPVDGVLVDVTCITRFYDFFERREGRWAIVRRQPIYEMDRMDTVAPDARLALDPELLSRYPEGYRHIAYVQTKLGFTVNEKLPQLKGPEVSQLYAEGKAWLAGANSAFAS